MGPVFGASNLMHMLVSLEAFPPKTSVHGYASYASFGVENS